MSVSYIKNENGKWVNNDKGKGVVFGKQFGHQKKKNIHQIF